MLPLLLILETTNTKAISLLTMDVKTRRLIGVNWETLEEALKSLNIWAKVLVTISNAMLDVLLVIEYAPKSLTGSILTTKLVNMETEYMRTKKTKVILYGVPLYISEDLLGHFFAKFGEFADVSSIRSKTGIATGDVEIMVTLTGKVFIEIPSVLICRGR